VLFFLFCLSSSCVLCTQCCNFLWIVHSWLPFIFSLYRLFMKVQMWHLNQQICILP
jgi:hypothetical protein